MGYNGPFCDIKSSGTTGYCEACGSNGVSFGLYCRWDKKNRPCKIRSFELSDFLSRGQLISKILNPDRSNTSGFLELKTRGETGYCAYKSCS